MQPWYKFGNIWMLKKYKEEINERKNKNYEKGRRILRDSVYGQDLSSFLTVVFTGNYYKETKLPSTTVRVRRKTEWSCGKSQLDAEDTLLPRCSPTPLASSSWGWEENPRLTQHTIHWGQWANSGKSSLPPGLMA